MATKRIADRVIDRLEDFNRSLRAGDKIVEKYTTRTVRLNLKRQAYNPRLIKKTRQSMGMSQAVFAQFIGASVKTVQAWEQGTVRPSTMARRFMDEIRHNPEYWKGRFSEMAGAK